MSRNNINLAICTTGELYGGAERFVNTFAEYLQNNTGINFVVVLFNEGELASKLTGAGIDTVTVLPRWKYDPTMVRRLSRLFKERRISVVHMHGYQATIWGAAAAKLCGARTIKTAHGKLEPARRRDLRWLRIQFLKWLDILATSFFVDHVVYVTRDLQAHWQKDASGSKSSVIYNAIPAILDDPHPTPLDMDDNAFAIGIIGRLNDVKGHKCLLGALKRLNDLKNLRLHVFGSGPLERELREICDAYGIGDRVKFEGFKDDIYSYLRAMDVIAIPSLYEGLPFTLLEAMYLGVPVVATRVGGMREILEHEKDSLLVSPGDEEGLSEAIRRLHSDPSLRASLAGNASDKIKADFTVDKMMERYLRLYETADNHSSDQAAMAESEKQ